MSLKLKHKIAVGCLAGSFMTGVAIHEAINTPDNNILLEGMITDESASSFIEEFENAVAGYTGRSPVVVLINSPGGYVDSGERIIEAIESAEIPVILKCNDLAASMAAEILITTQNVTRDASQDCEIILHRPRLIETTLSGEKRTTTLDDLYYDQYLLMQIFEKYENDPDSLAAFLYVWDDKQFQIDFIEQSSAELADNLSAHSHLSAQDFLMFFDFGDISIFAHEAYAFGFIDSIEGEALEKEISDQALQFSCVLWVNALSVCQEQLDAPSFFLPEF